MLIVACPKTASTSLLRGLQDVTGCPGDHVMGKRVRELVRAHGAQFSAKRYPGWWGLTVSSAVPCPRSVLRDWSEPGQFYVQHVVPEPDHFESIRALRMPWVLLLRSPDRAYAAHKRSGGKIKVGDDGVDETRAAFGRFVGEWVQFRDPFCLEVWFDDLITDSAHWMNRILAHGMFQARVDPGYELPREKFTGVGLRELKGA